MSNDDLHPLDLLDVEAQQSQEAFKKQVLQDSSTVFAVFKTQQGEKLLERWKTILMHSPTASPGLDSISIGMNEGYKAFIRDIINAIKIHEDQ